MLYTSLGFKAHSTKNRTRIAYATVEHGCIEIRLLVIVSGVAMDTTSFPPPEKKSAPPKKSRRAFGASATLARRRLSNNRAKFESRTGQNVAAASAASNTERAIETGGRAAAERLHGAARQQRDEAIEQQKKAEKEASEKTRECEAEKGEHVISFPLVPRALAEWSHEECAGHPCSNIDVETMQDAP